MNAIPPNCGDFNEPPPIYCLGCGPDCIYGSTWGGNTAYSSEGIATLKKQELGIQGLPVIPIEEIKNAKVVVEQDKSRVRFVLQGREIVYDRSGFHVQATASGPATE